MKRTGATVSHEASTHFRRGRNCYGRHSARLCRLQSATHVYRPEPTVVSPNEVVDFKQLFGQNCAGCHGADGKGGAAIALANPVFLAIADDTVIRRIASNGVPGTPMPAFAQSAAEC